MILLIQPALTMTFLHRFEIAGQSGRTIFPYLGTYKKILQAFFQKLEGFFAPLEVVRFSSADFKRPINLLHQQQSYHLVGKGHAGEGEFEIGPLAQLRSQAKSAADEKYDVAFAIESAAVDMSGEFFGGQVLSKYIENDAIAAVPNLL